MPERDQGADGSESELRGRLPPEHGHDVVGESPALARGVLGRRRIPDACVIGIGDLGAVAHGPDAVKSAHRECALHADGAGPALVGRQAGDQRMGPGPGRPDERARRQRVASLQQHGVGRRPRHPRCQPELDAPSAKPVEGVPGELGGELRQDAIAGVNEHEVRVLRTDARVEVEDTVHEVEQLRHHLGAGESSTRHREGQLAPALLGVGLPLGSLEEAQHVVAQPGCVLEGLQ